MIMTELIASVVSDAVFSTSYSYDVAESSSRQTDMADAVDTLDARPRQEEQRASKGPFKCLKLAMNFLTTLLGLKRSVTITPPSRAVASASITGKDKTQRPYIAWKQVRNVLTAVPELAIVADKAVENVLSSWVQLCDLPDERRAAWGARTLRLQGRELRDEESKLLAAAWYGRRIAEKLFVLVSMHSARVKRQEEQALGNQDQGKLVEGLSGVCLA